jgi:hypothetical protein
MRRFSSPVKLVSTGSWAADSSASLLVEEEEEEEPGGM